jgi:hypothetical protein
MTYHTVSTRGRKKEGERGGRRKERGERKGGGKGGRGTDTN